MKIKNIYFWRGTNRSTKTNSNFLFSENQIKNYNVVTSFRERSIAINIVLVKVLLASWPGRCVYANVGPLLFKTFSWPRKGRKEGLLKYV